MKHIMPQSISKLLWRESEGRVSVSRVRGALPPLLFKRLYQCVTESWVTVLLHVWLKSWDSKTLPCIAKDPLMDVNVSLKSPSHSHSSLVAPLPASLYKSNQSLLSLRQWDQYRGQVIHSNQAHQRRTKSSTELRAEVVRFTLRLYRSSNSLSLILL
jgi:hypothetical protein